MTLPSNFVSQRHELFETEMIPGFRRDAEPVPGRAAVTPNAAALDCSLEAREAGTYVQCESISLSRAIPTGLGWIVRPFVTGIPRESLEFTLGKMRTTLRTGA